MVRYSFDRSRLKYESTQSVILRSFLYLHFILWKVCLWKRLDLLTSDSVKYQQRLREEYMDPKVQRQSLFANGELHLSKYSPKTLTCTFPRYICFPKFDVIDNWSPQINLSFSKSQWWLDSRCLFLSRIKSDCNCALGTGCKAFCGR